eukprot:403367438
MSQNSGIIKRPFVPFEDTEEEIYSSECLDSQPSKKDLDKPENQNSQDADVEEVDSWDDHSQSDQKDVQESHDQSSSSDNNQSCDDDEQGEDELEELESQNQEDDLELDEEGRPKGVNKLFDMIKNDLGETQSESFKIFYDLMSNQIKYCLSQYINDDDDGEEEKQDSKGLDEKQSQKPIISPMVLINLIQQQKSLIMNVVNQKEQEKETLIREKGTKNKPLQIQADPKVVLDKIRIKLQPNDQYTLTFAQQKNNPLIMIVTEPSKQLKVILEYLSLQFGIEVDRICLLFENKQINYNHDELKLSQLLYFLGGDIQNKERKSQKLPTYNFKYEFREHPIECKEPQIKFKNKEKAINTKKLQESEKVIKSSSDQEEEDEDLNEEELLDMFTNIFSYMVIKKKQKQLRQNNNDKEARLPHPSSLLRKRKRKQQDTLKDLQENIRKRDASKSHLKLENIEQPFDRNFQNIHLNQRFGSGFPNNLSNFMIPQNTEQILSNSGQKNGESIQLYDTNPYFHQLMKFKGNSKFQGGEENILNQKE